MREDVGVGVREDVVREAVVGGRCERGCCCEGCNEEIGTPVRDVQEFRYVLLCENMNTRLLYSCAIQHYRPSWSPQEAIGTHPFIGTTMANFFFALRDRC